MAVIGKVFALWPNRSVGLIEDKSVVPNRTAAVLGLQDPSSVVVFAMRGVVTEAFREKLQPVDALDLIGAPYEMQIWPSENLPALVLLPWAKSKAVPMLRALVLMLNVLKTSLSAEGPKPRIRLLLMKIPQPVMLSVDSATM